MEVDDPEEEILKPTVDGGALILDEEFDANDPNSLGFYLGDSIYC